MMGIEKYLKAKNSKKTKSYIQKGSNYLKYLNKIKRIDTLTTKERNLLDKMIEDLRKELGR